jgi:hypothetical protein
VSITDVAFRDYFQAGNCPTEVPGKLAEVLWHQAQRAGQLAIRKKVRDVKVAPDIEIEIMHLIAAIRPNIGIRTYQVYYTGQDGIYAELPDVLLLAVTLGIPCYVINRGCQGIIGFDGNGKVIPNPDFSNIPHDAIVFWSNGGTGSGPGNHWDSYTRGYVAPRWQPGQAA